MVSGRGECRGSRRGLAILTSIPSCDGASAWHTVAELMAGTTDGRTRPAMKGGKADAPGR